MLFNVKRDLHGCSLRAQDGVIGKADEVYFDGVSWQVRYLVAATDKWLLGRKVLLAPQSLGKIDLDIDSIEIHLTKEQIKNSPDIDTDMPVSHQHQRALHEYYGWPMYWADGLTMGYEPVPMEVFEAQEKQHQKELAHADVNLRSSKEISGYHIGAIDGRIGHVEDIIVDDEHWHVHYLVVDTGHWLGRSVLIHTQWVSNISWEHSQIEVTMTKEAIENAPVYDHEAGVSRTYEQELFTYYGKKGYWDKLHCHK